MWPFNERRSTKRYEVDWEASLVCNSPVGVQQIAVRVLDVSLRGARLALDRLQVGPYHLVVGDQVRELRLSVSIPETEMLVTPVEISWYNFDEEKRLFTAGVAFLDMAHEGKKLLATAVGKL